MPELWQNQPRALLLFSGRPRDGDLASYLHELGWIVVVVDLVGPHPTDLLKEEVAKAIRKDIIDKTFDVVGAATPCETFSPLRENPPGPRPLRSLEQPMGLNEGLLSKEEAQQLRRANGLVGCPHHGCTGKPRP